MELALQKQVLVEKLKKLKHGSPTGEPLSVWQEQIERETQKLSEQITEIENKQAKLKPFSVKTIEQLKERFFSIQRTLLQIRMEELYKLYDVKPDISKHVLNSLVFNVESELNRKEMLTKLLNRTPGFYFYR